MSDIDGSPRFSGGSLSESSSSDDEAEEEVQDEAWRSGSQASSAQEVPPESGKKTLR